MREGVGSHNGINTAVASCPTHLIVPKGFIAIGGRLGTTAVYGVVGVVFVTIGHTGRASSTTSSIIVLDWGTISVGRSLVFEVICHPAFFICHLFDFVDLLVSSVTDEDNGVGDIYCIGVIGSEGCTVCGAECVTWISSWIVGKGTRSKGSSISEGDGSLAGVKVGDFHVFVGSGIGDISAWWASAIHNSYIVSTTMWFGW